MVHLVSVAKGQIETKKDMEARAVVESTHKLPELQWSMGEIRDF